MKFTLLFSILFFASQTFSQALLKQPFSNQDIQIISHQYAKEMAQNGDRALKQKLDSSHVRIFSAWSQSWVEGAKTRYDYFSDGSLKRQITDNYQAFSEIMEFNANGKIAYHKFQNWNGSYFEDSYNTVYIYNNGILQSDTNYNWSGGTWEASGYSEYQINMQGHIQEKISYHLQGSVPTPTQKFSFVNDPNGNILNLTTFQYLNLQWVNHYNYFYTYNSLNRIEVFYYQNWGFGNWENNYRSEFTYVSNDQTLMESFYWDMGAWIIETKQESQYDNSVATNAVLLPKGLSQNTHKIIGNQSYYIDNGSWGYVDTTTYFYSDVTPNSVSLLKKDSNYNLQTNPIVSEINIVNKAGVLSQIQVYTYTGKLVISKKSSSSLIRLDANKLPKGVYLVHIANDTERTVLKVMVSK